MYSVSKWPQTPSLGETMRQAHGGETSRLFFFGILLLLEGILLG